MDEDFISDDDHVFDELSHERIVEQFDSIEKLLEKFFDELHNSNKSLAPHIPPAMFGLALIMMGDEHSPVSDLGEQVQNNPDLAEPLQAVCAKIVAYGDMMFRFGQFCTTQGLWHEGLVQCNCLTNEIDQTIETILGGS